MDINLTNLQRQDPKILKIVDFATQVAVYEFNSQTNEWVGVSNFWRILFP